MTERSPPELREWEGSGRPLFLRGRQEEARRPQPAGHQLDAIQRLRIPDPLVSIPRGHLDARQTDVGGVVRLPLAFRLV